MKDKNQRMLLLVLILIVITILSYQTYSIYSMNQDIAELRVKQKTQDINIQTLKQEVQILDQRGTSQIASLSSQLEKSSSQLSELKNDVSNIQVESADFSGIVSDVTKAIVSVLTDVSEGSGVIIRSNGYIITNFHVIDGASIIKVLTSDKEIHPAKLIGYSKSVDLALLKIDANSLDYLNFGDSDNIKPGQKVIAIGNPAGLGFSVTEGIISAVHRKILNNNVQYVQTDVPINPGNSGGPLVNINKEIVGINDFKIRGYESLSFAIESNDVKGVVDKVFKELEQQNSTNTV